MSSSIQLQPPFRAEHIGSLLRPQALFEKRQQFESKQCTSSDLRPVEDNAIRHVVELQRNVGIKTITDGELLRLT
jgi:methionine synthase II (cobalamin-independent)